jgi:hypothetical protein
MCHACNGLSSHKYNKKALKHRSINTNYAHSFQYVYFAVNCDIPEQIIERKALNK